MPAGLTVYMPLLDEGTNVWRPVQVEELGEGRFRVMGPAPDEETWAFAPGSIVRVALNTFSDETDALTAIAEFPSGA